jgi:site-specific recombinase XerD
MRLTEALSRFITELRVRKAKATAAAYESDLRTLVKMAPLDTVLRFDTELIENYLAWESSRNRAMATLHRKQAAIRTFAKWCVRNRIIAEDPMARLEPIRRPLTLPRPFTPDESRRLLALELPERERLFRALLFYTGLRVTPILNIRLGDISDDPPTIRVTNKGNRQQLVYMQAPLAEAVRSYVLARTDLKPSTFLLTQDNGKSWNRKYAASVTKRWGAAAHVATCTCHRFRHAFASRLLEQTGDLRLVQEAMGHADIKSTTTYTLVTPERLRGAMERLNWDTL